MRGERREVRGERREERGEREREKARPRAGGAHEIDTRSNWWHLRARTVLTHSLTHWRTRSNWHPTDRTERARLTYLLTYLLTYQIQLACHRSY